MPCGPKSNSWQYPHDEPLSFSRRSQPYRQLKQHIMNQMGFLEAGRLQQLHQQIAPRVLPLRSNVSLANCTGPSGGAIHRQLHASSPAGELLLGWQDPPLHSRIIQRTVCSSSLHQPQCHQSPCHQPDGGVCLASRHGRSSRQRVIVHVAQAQQVEDEHAGSNSSVARSGTTAHIPQHASTASQGPSPQADSPQASSINGSSGMGLDEPALVQPPEQVTLREGVWQVPDSPTSTTPTPASSPTTASKRDVKSKAKNKVATVNGVGFAYPPAERSQIRESWGTLMRWSKVLKNKDQVSPLEATRKIVVFGGGSFGTAVGSVLAQQKADMDVVMLLRDPYLCKDINQLHLNTRYLKEFPLPKNMRATTSASEAITGAQYAVHAVPVQSSRAFLVGVRDLLPQSVPIICLSKGLEVGTGLMMSELIPSALERKQPAVFLSGPSFAREVMENRPTGVVAACKDGKLNRTVQALFANRSMRVNTTSDVVGVEICGALKNVLAIAAGIVEGLDLGHNAMAALIAQGCSEIRWLSEKMGAKPTTMSGLSGLGDIMLTCYGNLSRNRTVGIRLGQGEKLEDILASSPQVAEGVATAGVVVSLARKYRVSLPVLTAVAQVLDNALTPSEAVAHIMNLPQIEER